MFLSFVMACAFWFLFRMSAAVQHDRTKGAEPTRALLLTAAFVMIPYVVSFALFSVRRHESIAAGAGVAAVFFGITVLVSPYLLLVMFMVVGLSASDHGPDGMLLAAGIVLLAFLGTSVWIVWSALRIARIRWRAFLIAACATGIYVYAGYHQVISATVIGKTQIQRQKQQSDIQTLNAENASPAAVASRPDRLLFLLGDASFAAGRNDPVQARPGPRSSSV